MTWNIYYFGTTKKAQPKHKYKPKPDQSSYQDPDNRLEQTNAQLSMAMRGGYGTKPLLNKTEKMIFHTIRKLIKDEPLHCFPQVSCSEIFTHKDETTYRATANSKRSDFCITDNLFNPVAIVEYQGSGHTLPGDSGNRNAVKSIVSQSAEIIFIQLFEKDNYTHKLTTELASLMKTLKLEEIKS